MANIQPAAPDDINGNFTVEIPYPYPQFTDMEFFITAEKNNLFIPQRMYRKIDDYNLLISNNAGVSNNDELRFTFCHNDGKFHVKKLEFSYKAQPGATYDLKEPLWPYKKRIDDTEVKFKIFVNRVNAVLNLDYTVNNEEGTFKFISNIVSSTNDRIDVLVFFTGIDDTAIADLPMSGYIYLKRNMIDRNYNNNLMATFINGKLIERDKILHISNNIYKIKEDIKSRHDLQLLNMSNRINCMVPFYKQHTMMPMSDTMLEQSPEGKWNIVDNTNPRYMEYAFPIKVVVPLITYGRQHITMYHNPVYFSPSFLLENKDKWISFVQVLSPYDKLKYTLTLFDDDISPKPSSDVRVKVELHIKTPYEEQLEESRSNILLCKLPSVITQVENDYCYCSFQIKQLIKLDIWNNRFIESCDGIIFRIESGRYYKNKPCDLYLNLQSNEFEDFEKEQITIFEYRITDKYDGLGNIYYRKELAFNPEESVKKRIRESDRIKT